MCYANGASAQLPSASPPSPLKSKTLKESSLPVEVFPVHSPHSGACSSEQECSFAAYSESQGAECDKDNFGEGDTEHKVACSCSGGGSAHRSESCCNQHRHTSSAVDKDRGSMEPVVTGRHLPEWSQTNGTNTTFFPYAAVPSLSPSPPVPPTTPPAGMIGPVCTAFPSYPWLPGVYYQPVPRYRHDKSDRLEVCRDFIRGTCIRSPEECRFAHPSDHIIFDESDSTVIVCMDFIKGSCTRPHCKYLHPPPHLQTAVRARQNRVYFGTPQSPLYSPPGAFVPPGYSRPPQPVAYPMPAATGFVGGYQPQPMYLPMPVPMPSPPPTYYQESLQPPSPAQHMVVATTTFPTAIEDESRSTHTTCSEEGRNVIEHTLE